jgi:hypothetical protein
MPEGHPDDGMPGPYANEHTYKRGGALAGFVGCGSSLDHLTSLLVSDNLLSSGRDRDRPDWNKAASTYVTPLHRLMCKYKPTN